MEQVTKYLNFDFLCKLSAVGTGVVIAQKVVGSKEGRGLKGQATNFVTVLGGIVLGGALHSGVTNHVYSHGHAVSSATKARNEKASDTSEL